MANFSASATSGCNPLTNVQFTDLSTGNPTTWVWRRNGVIFSYNQNVTATFSPAGTYTIQLTASNSSGSSTHSATITVHANPSSNFIASSSTSGCNPHTVTFQDQSTSTNSSIVSRLWSFGDGGQSALANPAHTYSLSGNFPVSLKVTDGNGCEDTKQIPNYIQVYNRPNAAFSSPSSRQTCAPPLNVSFSNSSTGNGTLSYLWKFGDGNTSTASTPSHTYNSYGNFTVKLVVTDGNGCKDSISYPAYVQIQNINANFNKSADSVCLGDTIKFTNTSQGANTFLWNFGDNTTGGGFSPKHVYQDSGHFQVRLISSIPTAGCSDTVFKSVYIQRVVADFSVSPTYICQLPDTVVYTNNSTNYSSYDWYREIACPRDLPIYRCGLPQQGDTIPLNPMTRFVQRIYSDTLVVKSNLGCTDTMMKDTSFIVSLVNASPILSRNKGCIPYNINFSSSGALPNNPSVFTPSPPPSIVSHKWVVDDTIYSNLAIPPNIVVSDTGSWLGYYQVTNSLGCKDSAQFNYVAGDSVNADFTMLYDSICVSGFDTAFSLASDTNYINSYRWFTSPNTNIGTGNKLAFIRPNSIGSHSVGHIVDHNGCADTIVKQNAFYAKGPLVQFTPSLFNCTDSTTIAITSWMQQASRWYWDFGDSTLSIDSTSVNPIVNYSKKGTYIITLTAYNADSTCEDQDVVGVIAGEIRAKIASDTGKINALSDFQYEDTIHACAPAVIHFSAYGSASALSCDWYFNGVKVGPVSRDSILTRTFSTRGFHDVRLIVFDTVAGCADTTDIVVAAYKPIVDFTGNPASGCIPLNAQLIPNIQTFNKIEKYRWQVGTITDTTDTFNRAFTNFALLNAKLTVTDQYGCSDSLTKQDYIKASSLNVDFFATNVRQLCVGDSIQLIQSVSNSNVEYIWLNGLGDTTTGNSPYLHFPDSGALDITLIATDTITGCVKTLIKPNFIFVQTYPNPDFYGTPTDSTCYPVPVQFYADTNMPYYPDLDYYWTLGDFSAASNFPNPFYNYVEPGSYTVTLTVTTSFGCKDSIGKVAYININGPFGEFDFTPDSICRGDSVFFRLFNAENVQDFGFDFGDGTSSLNQSTVWHTYADSLGNVYPTLYFTDSIGGCSKTFTDTLYIFETEADFTLNDTAGCMPFDPVIQNRSIDVQTYDWDFGDGSNSTSTNPSKIYNTPGSYTLWLRVKGRGCSDSTKREIVVYPLPIAMAETDTLICEGDSVQLYAEGGVAYLWTPAGGLSNSAISAPIASPQISTGYQVEVADTNDCRDIDSVLIIVQKPIDIDLDDLVLIVGDTLTLTKAFGGEGVKYKWNPPDGLSCDTCPQPVLTALESGTYTVTITDTNNCFATESTFYLEVQDKYTLDVPEAFTPNGDGVNDIVYVRGWGLKELITFRIYNRWGELIFESNDLNVGWDGSYKGELQGVEVYAYYVEALTYGNTVLKKKGNISLLR